MGNQNREGPGIGKLGKLLLQHRRIVCQHFRIGFPTTYNFADDKKQTVVKAKDAVGRRVVHAVKTQLEHPQPLKSPSIYTGYFGRNFHLLKPSLKSYTGCHFCLTLRASLSLVGELPSWSYHFLSLTVFRVKGQFIERAGICLILQLDWLSSCQQLPSISSPTLRCVYAVSATSSNSLSNPGTRHSAM